MILGAILTLTGVAAVASIINLFDNKTKHKQTISLKKQMPGGLPIISLSNNGNMLNFILDSGSNISHICEEYYKSINSKLTGVYNNIEVSGLGSINTGVTMCKATFKDTVGHEYDIDLSISNHLSDVAKSIKAETGVQIHGLLGTDFLEKYNYVIDFKTLEVYPK